VRERKQTMTRSIEAPLLDTVAMVTGAGRGIGRGIALDLARHGADVALVDVSADAIASVADEIAEIGSKATTFVADVSDRRQVFDAVDHAASALGGFDVMVNNAAAAKEHAADGITVNAYCPGVVGTDMWVEIDKRFAELTGAAEGETFEKFSATIALGRSETPDDVAGFVTYLAGPGADYMTGQAGLIDGGMVYR
jgi:NAD(P)-dependent dehydrogenase (short-subunit alcohol dehydrogenase family)